MRCGWTAYLQHPGLLVVLRCIIKADVSPTSLERGSVKVNDIQFDSAHARLLA